MLIKEADEVVPHAGTWIEICHNRIYPTALYVVPHAGTWIEIFSFLQLKYPKTVVPHAGTWIEMGMMTMTRYILPGSFPTQKRELKYDDDLCIIVQLYTKRKVLQRELPEGMPVLDTRFRLFQ